MPASVREDIETLFMRLLLGSRVDRLVEADAMEVDYALARAIKLLEARQEQFDAQRFELRLRLAMHLSPANAIEYVPTNPTPRHQLISDHLRTEFGKQGDLVAQLARDVAKLLTSWDEVRHPASAHLNSLLERQRYRCAHCHVLLRSGTTPESVHRRDSYKPYFESEAELLSPEVDHIEAISSLGTNDVTNLQVLCRLCNGGKGDGLGLDVREELKNAGKPILELSVGYRSRMLYYTLLRSGQRCSACNSDERELTIRPIRENGGFIRTNIRATCYACLPV